jgi:NitT/TauT family transport system substrate-binding protein
MNSFKRIPILLVLVVMLFGCGREDTGSPEGLPVLTVGHVGHDHQIALYIAALKGRTFVERYGVGLVPRRDGEVYDLVEEGRTLATLRLMKVGGGSKMPAALSRGDIDIGLGGVPAIAKLADAQGSRGVKIICPLQTDGDMLVLAADSTVNTWSDFVAAARSREKPLVIGYKAPLAVALLVFQRALDAENISWSMHSTNDAQVVLQNMRGGRNAIPLLSGGELDGFVMNQPVVAIAEQKGLGKTVAALRDLPPMGTWANHPCCCVCATDSAIEHHPAVLKALLKTIHLGDAFIRENPREAAELAAQWIKSPLEVEQASLPTISYGTLPDGAWRTGLQTWLTMMTREGLFTGRFAGKSPEEIFNELCDLRFCAQAAEELQSKGHLPIEP